MIVRLVTRELMIAMGTLLIVAGCTAEPSTPARSLIDVQGTVTQNGKPVPQTIVLFVPVDEGGTQAKGVTDHRGRYRLIHESGAPGAQAGEYKVVFQTLPLRASPDGGDPVDAAYSDQHTTPFHARVSADAATFHFDLSRRSRE